MIARAHLSLGLARALLALISISTSSACTLHDDGGSEAEIEAGPEWLVADSIEYVLRVDWEDAERVGDERVFTTARGYTVGVRRWSQAMTNIELVPCDVDDLEELEEGFRHIGHIHDVSQIELQLVEEIVDGGETWLGPVAGSGVPYCGVYEILGDVAFAAGEDELVTHLEGWWQAPGETERVPFAALNSVSVSVLPGVDLGVFDGALSPGSARVELRRWPARAFDDIDFQALSELEVAFEAAGALARGATIDWAVADTPATW